MRCDRFSVLTEWPAAATSVSRAQAPGRGSVWAGLGGWAGQGTDSFSLWRAGARVLHCHDMQRHPSCDVMSLCDEAVMVIPVAVVNNKMGWPY